MTTERTRALLAGLILFMPTDRPRSLYATLYSLSRYHQRRLNFRRVRREGVPGAVAWFS